MIRRGHTVFDTDINCVPVLDMLIVNGSMSFLNVMDLAVVARLYHFQGYIMKAVCMFVFQKAFTTHGTMSESRYLAFFLREH